MNSPRITHLLAALALTAVLVPPAFAEPPADKGKGQGASASQPHGTGQPKADTAGAKSDDAKAKGEAHMDDKGKAHDDDGNHGQVVSECNHRANDKNLKGKERQDYVEWCTDRGEHYKYDDRRYDQDRSCYRKADDKGLSGDFRRVFIQDCLRTQEKSR